MTSPSASSSMITVTICAHVAGVALRVRCLFFRARNANCLICAFQVAGAFPIWGAQRVIMPIVRAKSDTTELSRIGVPLTLPCVVAYSNCWRSTAAHASAISCAVAFFGGTYFDSWIHIADRERVVALTTPSTYVSELDVLEEHDVIFPRRCCKSWSVKHDFRLPVLVELCLRFRAFFVRCCGHGERREERGGFFVELNTSLLNTSLTTSLDVVANGG